HNWYPVWEAAAECNFPIAFHSTGFTGARPPSDEEMAKEYRLEHGCVPAVLFQVDGAETLVSLIASGACEKYPDFRFVLGECRVSWLPYILDRFDVEYEDRFHYLNFSMKPSDYFKRQCYLVIDPDEEPAKYALDWIGDDNFIFSTDYPHPDGKYPFSTEAFLKLPLSEEAKRKVLWDNCARLYGVTA
ncbi:MAG: amidohydrolase family protein, partial [Chloroflexi bacterium]|nr:amidohydrolase family protein [Chloroflexota bacterium]